MLAVDFIYFEEKSNIGYSIYAEGVVVGPEHEPSHCELHLIDVARFVKGTLNADKISVVNLPPDLQKKFKELAAQELLEEYDRV